MSKTTSRRRRWYWLIAAAALILVAGRVAWRYRPLTKTEVAMIGTWLDENRFSGSRELVLTADRRFICRDDGKVVCTGSWRATGVSLRFSSDERLSWSTLRRDMKRMARGLDPEGPFGVSGVYINTPDQLAFTHFDDLSLPARRWNRVREQ